MNSPLITLLLILGIASSGFTQQTASETGLPQKLQDLTAKVSALPTNAAAGITKAMLCIALERAKACIDAGDTKDAQDLINDVGTTLTKNPESLTSPSTQTNTISVLRPPHVVDGNPYIARLVAGAKEDLAKPDKPFAKNTPTVNTFSGLSVEGGSRSAGDEMQAWLWLFANPASPLKGDPKVLERYLRVANAYADAIDVHGGMSLAGTPLVGAQGSKGNENAPLAGQGIFDDFAIAPASCALREFAQLYPGLLLPSQKALWDRAMKTGGAVMWLKAKDREGVYANIDLALAFEMLNFGLYLDNKEYLDKSRFLYEAQEKSIYPDGAIAYLGHQNESANYHNSDTRDLARIYEVNQDPKVLELLKKTEWYAPVTCGKRGEFWTVPSWKDTWNDGNPIWTGGESVAALTGNPYLRGLNDTLIASQKDLKGWPASRLNIFWYRNDVKPLPLPNNYTVIDRNIVGPRAWYGRFNYAASTRPIPENEPGLATIMGTQLTDTNGQAGQILMGVYPRVRLSANELSKNGSFNRQAFAWRTYGLKSAIVTGRSFSAVAGSYQLQQYRSSTAGDPVDWSARQLWLGLPDRIIGLVEISPNKDGAQAIDVEGVLRLGTGGTVNGKPTKIISTGTNSWSYGDLSITLFGHNYSTVQTPEIPYRLPKFPNTEIRLFDTNGAVASQSLNSYPATTKQWFLVEVRPEWSKKADSVSIVDQPTGVFGFQSQSGQKKFGVLYNPTDSVLEIPASVLAKADSSSLHRSDETVSSPVPKSLIMKPQELAVMITSPESQDHLKGWDSLQQMLSSSLDHK